MTPPRSPLLPYRWGEADTEARLWALEVQRRTLRRRLLEEHPDPEMRAKLQGAERERCRRDRVHWIENWCWMYDPHASSPPRMHVPAVLWPRQVELHAFMDERWNAPSSRPGGVGEDWAVRKGRREGVTWQHLFFVAHLFTLGRQLRSRLLSSKEAGADDGTEECLFGMLRYCLSQLPAFLCAHDPEKEYSRLYLGCAATGAQIVGESMAAGVSRGLRTGLFLFDEFAHPQNPNLPKRVVASTESVARSRAFVSTPAGPGTEFARICARLPSKQVFQMSYRDDPSLPEDFREQKILGGMDAKLFDQEYGGKEVVLTSALMFEGPKDPERFASWAADPRERTEKGDCPRLDIRAIQYHDESPDWREANRAMQIQQRGFLCGGWDFGTSAVSALVCLRAIVEPGPMWRLWIDAEHKWEQKSWMTAAEDVLSWDRYRYHPRPASSIAHWGDPAGIARESDLKSWQENLRAGGIPLTCLHAYYNTRDGQEWAFREAQSLIDSGRLRVHARCTYLWGCLENWARAVPHGAAPELLNRLYIPPMHDGWSHGGMAFTYLVAGVILGIAAGQSASQDHPMPLPPSPGGGISGMISAASR